MHPEIGLFWEFITTSINEIIATLDGCSSEELNWRLTDDANSLYSLATHTMSSAEHFLLRTLCEGPGERDRDAEFVAVGDSIEPLKARWQELQTRIQAGLAELSGEILDERTYLFGRHGQVSGCKLLILVARHSAEHKGHAELTRDLLVARR